MSARSQSETLTIRTEGVSILLGDSSSEIFNEAAMTRMASDKMRGERVAAAVGEKEAIWITTLLDGTFKVRLTLMNEMAEEPTGLAEFLVGSEDLELTSGRLVVRGAQKVESSLPFVRGVYAVKVSWSVEEECKHYGIDVEADYPGSDGPDGVVTFWRLFGP